ncbi:addiction module toxin, RelE/StbE family [Granulicatella balaenopterae]|uniref:Addiction module toxin, RelE/StbE family n=1 Tax=Granulicatella balaenopterae TaxID=137733 RepID=A0A1H9NUS4_9LACT|nr:type II toxin-antitoxin system RelE/ParE family toxin [Granulicatella balaenopterae]SER39093.1 addiction module toxin, RelE/StbE family [Granulicatella balaenopterae]
MDRYEIKITRQAKEQLVSIKKYIVNTLKAPKTAKNIIRQLRNGMDSLTTMPERYKIINESPYSDYGIRKMRIKNYYIYYVIIQPEKRIDILAVIYVKREQVEQLDGLNYE